MKKFISILLVVTILLSFAACKQELTVNEYDESQLSGGTWTQAEYLGYHEDTSTAAITAEVKIGWQHYYFYCDSQPTLKVGEIIEVYFTTAEEILAVR